MIISGIERGFLGLSVVKRARNLPLRRCRSARTLYHSFLVFSRQFVNIMSSAGIIKIGTHDGVFHCDEALACFMLNLLPEYANSEVIRTRDSAQLATCHTVVDVGAKYDHARRRYDHHQREFTGTLSQIHPGLGDHYNIKLSSAGLVYAHYGESVIQQVIANKNLQLDPDYLKLVYKKVYENLIEEIDAIDNGVPMTETEPKYKIRTNISARVARLNPEWNSTRKHDSEELFEKAMALVGEELLYTIEHCVGTWLPARSLVKDGLHERFRAHESGQIVEFEGCFPWREHLFDLEAELGIPNIVKYVIYNDKPDSWKVQAVPVSPTSFVSRKPLLRAWWGVRDDLLSEVAGVPGCIFCHSNGFLAGNSTRDGALQMAVLSLQEPV